MLSSLLCTHQYQYHKYHKSIAVFVHFLLVGVYRSDLPNF